MFVLPTVPISPQAERTHGFTTEYLQSVDALSQKEALERFSAFASGCVLVGHNSDGFDSPLLKRCFFDEGLPFPEVRGEADTMLLARAFLPYLPDYKLSTLCSEFGVVNECAHNALGDITATAGCLKGLLDGYVLPTTSAREEI